MNSVCLYRKYNFLVVMLRECPLTLPSSIKFQKIGPSFRWVEVGAKPIPRKYVITSKTVAGAPQYSIRFKSWKTGVSFLPDAFTFTAPSDAQKVMIEQLPHLDEIPKSTPLADQK
ncbi:DUF2092 domain-containing protein [Beijerinckia mobilis]|uniref:DUF2092 domain-containing protein n=1 Tax=Beijerinckia mobilis TaxID=231434 RepID=UPI000A03844B|nr:DUF2092 domain-containing protein [Beijerinckia mobilis]